MVGRIGFQIKTKNASRRIAPDLQFLFGMILSQKGCNFLRCSSKKPGIRRAHARKFSPGVNHLLNALIRLLNRETLRDAVFACTIPFCAARMTKGSATRRAADAAP